ncbi:MAG: valine--tRNA ligase [Firmicutes bacterium]|nr:valine--tRNA ligase [Bacillota bacterium]
MDKNFDFKRAEAEHNAKWIDNAMFRAVVNPDKKPYTIIMPPPNITARLHVGHALTYTIQDAIIRFKRMQGFEALMLPGADHAAIATEVKVAEELKKQGIDKRDLSPEEFMVHINKWYVHYTAEIKTQMKRLGLSCDWSRFGFTMDDQTTLAVNTVFHNLYAKGLIYQGERMINYCTTCGTAVSDAEVEHEARSQTLFTIRFGNIDIATVRPEAIFSAAAVAVNPRDKRYAKLVGKMATIPFINIEIPIIADETAEMKFGTGAVQMTAHSTQSHEFTTKYNITPVKVIGMDGKMFGERVGEFAGMTVAEARKAVAKKLKDEGFLVSEKKHTSNVGVCYRCHVEIEPFVSLQWFVKMKELAKPAIEALNNGLMIVPKKFEKVYLHWLNNIRDWCISRQLLSGHKIPIDGVDDKLDTWFSSALWPFSTLGWPDKTDSPDFKYFYPTDTLVTAYEIIFFWVIRMVFSGIEHTGQLPFHTVLMHGLVRDKIGRKMSKSLGNGIDPLEVIEEYGADVMRFSLIVGTKLDRDPRYSIEKAVLARNFINKIWNAVKFFNVMAADGIDDEINPKALCHADKWILTKLNAIIKSTTKKHEKFDFGVAANELQSFFWNDFCDWYLETVKVSGNKRQSLAVFRHVLVNFLKLMNPLMPYVTEEIYCNVLKMGETIAFEAWPVSEFNFAREKREFDSVIEVVETLRTNKSDDVTAVAVDWAFAAENGLVEKLSGVKIEWRPVAEPTITTKISKIHLVVDEDARCAKVEKQIAHIDMEIERCRKMLSNPGFTNKAPRQKVKEEEDKLLELERQREILAGGK